MKNRLTGSRRLFALSTLSSKTYNGLAGFIVNLLRDRKEVDFRTLIDLALADKSLPFEGDLCRCVIQVKRDLEGKGIIKVTFGKGPERIQMIRLAKSKASADFGDNLFLLDSIPQRKLERTERQCLNLFRLCGANV